MQDEKRTMLHTSQWLPGALPEIFDFFSRPENLQKLTPPHMSFHILTPPPIVMQEELKLDYKLKVHGLPLRWTSLISKWNPPHSFTDKQIKGPYREWTHTHSFSEEGEGTLVEDHIVFKVPGGRLVEKLVVQKDLASVFSYRHQMLEKIFGTADK